MSAHDGSVVVDAAPLPPSDSMDIDGGGALLSMQQEQRPARLTAPILTKYERARLLGARSEQIAAGAPVLVAVPRGTRTPYDIAVLELAAKKIPLLVRRVLPDGTYEDWRVAEFEYSGG